VELRRPANMPLPDRRRWAELTARAQPGNIFAQDWFMEPALRHCGTQGSLRLAIVRQASGAWLGVLPLTLARATAGHPVPTWQGWHAADQFLGTPLVQAGAEKTFWQALLAHLDQRPGLALGFGCGTLPVADPITLALATLCAEQGRKLHVTQCFTRRARLPASRPDAKALRKLDQRLDTLEARLTGEFGPVAMVLHDRDADCEPWLAAFQALERAGWKGRSALRPSRGGAARGSATAGLLRDVLRLGHRNGTVRLASLIAGEQIVAMTSWFIADGYGYGFKMAYDKAWRAHAPGRLLMRRVARSLDTEAPLLFDTCTDPDAPGDPLWPDRRALGGFAVGIGGPTRRRVFDTLMAVDARSAMGLAGCP